MRFFLWFPRLVVQNTPYATVVKRANKYTPRFSRDLRDLNLEVPSDTMYCRNIVLCSRGLSGTLPVFD